MQLAFFLSTPNSKRRTRNGDCSAPRKSFRVRSLNPEQSIGAHDAVTWTGETSERIETTLEFFYYHLFLETCRPQPSYLSEHAYSSRARLTEFSCKAHIIQRPLLLWHPCLPPTACVLLTTFWALCRELRRDRRHPACLRAVCARPS
jgi:hypothetical protein